MLLGHIGGDKRVVRDDFHPKSLCSLGNLHTDFAEPHNAQSLTAQFCALERFLFPFSRVHQRVCATQMPGHSQHHAECVFGHGHRIGARRIHDSDTLAGGCLEIDVVHPDPGATNHAQLIGVLEQGRIHLNCRPYQ